MNRERSVLEVMKWASYWDLCENANFVCRFWSKMAENEELWEEICEICGFSTNNSAKTSQKSRFLSHLSHFPNYFIEKISIKCIKAVWEPTQPLQIPTNFSHFSRITAYPPYLIVTGSNSSLSHQIALINYTTGSVFWLNNLQNPRFRHGCVHFNGKIYLFGGVSTINNALLDSIEALNIENSATKWVFLPSLCVKTADFIHFRLDYRVFVMGGCGTNECQIVDLRAKLSYLMGFRVLREGNVQVSRDREGLVVRQGQWSWKIREEKTGWRVWKEEISGILVRLTHFPPLNPHKFPLFLLSSCANPYFPIRMLYNVQCPLSIGNAEVG